MEKKQRRGQRLTRRQKEIVSAQGLVPRNWLCIEEAGQELIIQSKSSKQRRKIVIG